MLGVRVRNINDLITLIKYNIIIYKKKDEEEHRYMHTLY